MYHSKVVTSSAHTFPFFKCGPDFGGLDDCGEKSHAELSSMTVEELRKWQAEVNQARSDIYCGPVDEHMLERKERTEVSLCLAVCLCLGVEASLCVSVFICMCLCVSVSVFVYFRRKSWRNNRFPGFRPPRSAESHYCLTRNLIPRGRRQLTFASSKLKGQNHVGRQPR